jgi:2'-hydroxyisoflavone reductase
MRILVLGGTRFAGRHFVDSAVQRGHQVTLFNRGVSEQGQIPGVEQLHGDRDGGLQPLESRDWEAVVDMSGFVPRAVRASAELLAGHAGRYLFVSSISAYADGMPPGFAEDASLATLEDPSIEEITGETYGALKALCEREVERAFPGGALIIRPGLIVGPRDPTDRFTYWVRRVARGGEVLAPGSPGRPVQVIDARDLATWMLRMVEGRETGAYHATGPEVPLSMGEILETCRAVSGSDAAFTWVNERFLLDAGVEPWSELPLWLPEAEAGGAMQADVSRAVRHGLTFRHLAETARDTHAWDVSRPQADPLKAGLDGAREAGLLARWRASNPPA